MGRSYARILLSVWRDEDFLKLSSGAQRLYFVLLSQPTVSACGVTTFTLRRLARFAANTSEATVEKDLTELAEGRYVVTDDDTEELWLLTYMKHDGILDQPNMVLSAADAFEGVLSGRIRQGIVEWLTNEYPQGFRSYLLERFPNGFKKGLPEGLLKPLEEGLGEDSYTRACAHTPSPSPSPTPSPSPGAPENLGRHPQTAALLARWMGLVQKPTPLERIRSEATIDHLLDHMAANLVDESIGRADQDLTDQPRSYRVLLTIAQSTCDRYGTGIRIPKLELGGPTTNGHTRPVPNQPAPPRKEPHR